MLCFVYRLIMINLPYTIRTAKYWLCLLGCLGTACFALVAQPLPFEPVPFLPFWHNTTVLTNPFAGGLNNPQFSAIDLDNDQTDDLVIFDRAGNKIITFINSGDTAANAKPYHYAPQYETYFPNTLHDWVLLRDYTADGLPDLFTSSNTGISAYRAHRNADNSLTFELESDKLRYLGLAGSPLNIPSSTIEIPTFADLNQDGDLDILNFNSGGTKVEYFENQSQEMTGSAADTLWFLRYDKCWGDFQEDQFSNQITLFADCNGGSMEGKNWYDNAHETEISKSANRDNSINKPLPISELGDTQNSGKSMLHSGSSLLTFDADHDGDYDLLVGDILSPRLTLLTNGNANDAYMVAKDTLFPANSDLSVNIHLFPAAFYMDSNNDSLPDLIIAPNETNSQSTQQVWRYLHSPNDSTTTGGGLPFVFDSNCFLLCDMIDAGVRSYPTIIDYNLDGKQDIIIGNLGYYNSTDNSYTAQLMLYENIGTPNYPSYNLVSDNFGMLSDYGIAGLYPAFADLDNDGDQDMIAGSENGFLHFFRNTALPTAPMQLELETLNYLEVPMGDSATPCFWDMDNDGKMDLIVGEKAGKLNLFRNISSGDLIEFELQNNFWGQVDVRTAGNLFGYSAPFIANDTLGQPYLLVNSESGRIFAYTDLNQSVFSPLTDFALPHNEGGRGGIAIADLNNNGSSDMLIGNQRGGLGIYAQAPGIPLSISSIAQHTPNIGAMYDSNGQILSIYGIDSHIWAHLAANNVYHNANMGLNWQLYSLQGQYIRGATIDKYNNRVYRCEIGALPKGIYIVYLPQLGISLKLVAI